MDEKSRTGGFDQRFPNANAVSKIFQRILFIYVP